MARNAKVDVSHSNAGRILVQIPPPSFEILFTYIRANKVNVLDIPPSVNCIGGKNTA